MTIDEIKELYKMIAERDDSIGDLISKIAGKDTRIAELEKENERLILKNNWYHEEHAKEMNKIAELEKQIAELEKDNKRLDWLADKNNHIGNVMLPTQCVVDNLSSLRGAIDAAMEVDNE